MVRAWNEPFTMYGLVAQSVDVAPDRSWIEFHLDPSAKFHDGHPITSDDVVFSYKSLMQYGRPNQRRIYKLIKTVTTKDSHTIRFDFGPGFDRETVMILSNMPVLPKHYWQGKDFSKTTLTPPMSSGPYQITSVQPGQRVVFDRVTDYWAKDKPVNHGLYNFGQLRYDFFRDDRAALQSLASNQIDLRKEYSAVAWQRNYNFTAVQSGEIVKKTFKNGRPMRARFLVYNMRRPQFSDIRVREALAYAFDFEWINKNLFLGTQTRLSSIYMNSELADQSADKFVAPKTDGTGIAGMRNNLRHAIELLQQAGWTLQNGVLLDKNNRPFAFEILLNDPTDEKIALEYTRALQHIGIQAHVRTVDSAQYIGRLSQFDFDMTLTFWRNSLSPGTEQAVYWGSVAADQQGSFNYSGVRSPDIDRHISELTTAKTRADLVKAAQQLDHAVMKQWIGVPLFDTADDMVAIRQNITIPDRTPLYGPVIESWWYSAPKSGKEDSKDSSSQSDAVQ
jgi:ABC-type oligopeptide transport system substrate-binding subunit